MYVYYIIMHIYLYYRYIYIYYTCFRLRTRNALLIVQR